MAASRPPEGMRGAGERGAAHTEILAERQERAESAPTEVASRRTGVRAKAAVL
jgi:hypothetical protein